MKKITQFLLPVIVLVACGLIARWVITNKKKPERHEPERPPVVVDAVRLQRQDYQVVLKSNGTVRPHTESTILPEISGRIIHVSPNFRDGGFFEASELLLQIDDRNYQAALTVAQSELLSARLTVKQERIRVENYRTELAITESSLAQARLALAEEEAKAKQAKEDWERLNPGDIPDDLVLRKPQIRSSTAAVAAAEAQVEQIRRNMGLGPQELEAAEGDLAAAEARLDEQRLNLERTRITAPYSGRILEKSVDIGQYVSPGTTLAKIYAIDFVEIRLPLTNRQLEFINIPEQYRGEPIETNSNGPPVVIGARIGSKDHFWEGKIVRTEGSIDTRSRQLFVIAKVNDPYGKKSENSRPLKVGQFVKADIQGNRLKNVFIIPRSAVREGKEVLIINKENQLFRRSIDITWSDTESVIVKDNLDNGDLLCLTPLPFAVEGTMVRPKIEDKNPLKDIRIDLTDQNPVGSKKDLPGE